MEEKNKNKKTFDLECVQEGFANGVAPGFPLNDKQKQKMIDRATKAYGKFLTELGCDWENDPNSNDTPRRVAKMYVNEIFYGLDYNNFPKFNVYFFKSKLRIL